MPSKASINKILEGKKIPSLFSPVPEQTRGTKTSFLRNFTLSHEKKDPIQYLNKKWIVLYQNYDTV